MNTITYIVPISHSTYTFLGCRSYSKLTGGGLHLHRCKFHPLLTSTEARKLTYMSLGWYTTVAHVHWNRRFLTSELSGKRFLLYIINTYW